MSRYLGFKRTDGIGEKIKSIVKNINEEKPPSSVGEAEKNIKKSLLLYLDSFIEDDFNYRNWEESPKNKFNKARIAIMENIINELQGEIIIPVISKKAAGSAFDFEPIEVRKDVLTLQDYLEMKK